MKLCGYRMLLVKCLSIQAYSVLSVMRSVRPIKLLFDLSVEDLLLVNGFEDFSPALDGWLYKRLTLTQLQESFSLLKLLFVLFEGLVNVFAVFGIDDQHIVCAFKYANIRGLIEMAKG